MDQYHGWMELFFGVGVLILGVVLAWAVMKNRHRNRANDVIGNAAAKDQIEHPDSYDPEKYRRQLGPKS